MLVHFVSKGYTDQLYDTRKDQIRKKGSCVLGSASGKSKAVFKVIDGAFYGSSDLIKLIPFGSYA